MCILHNGDCLDYLKTLPENSIDAVVTDPPYFEIKGDFDFQYESFQQFLDFFEQCAIEWKRVLKKSGSLLVFGHAKRIAYKQVILDKYFNLENSLVWEVYDRQTKKGIDNFRCFAPITERMLFYSCEVERTGLEEIKLDINNFQPLRAYFKQVQGFIGLGLKAINEKLGHRKAEHGFYWNSTQWDLPTLETYTQLIWHFGIDKMAGFREYESLRQEYESLRQEYESLRQEYESLRRPFNNIHGLTDVIKHSQDAHITKDFNHDTVKPVGLMSKLIETITRENDTVLDCFMGSGSTGVAAVKLKRKFIGVEMNPDYFKIASERIADAGHDLDLMFGT